MNAFAALERALLAFLLGVAIVGAAGLAILSAHAPMPAWLLPAGAALAVVLAWRIVPDARPLTGAPAPRWLALAGVVVLAVVAVALTYGALATPSRHWDGAVAWDAKAYWLARDPTLQQPYFRAGAVYCHSRDYPLLQPLLLALGERAGGCGRLLFPLGFLAMVGLVGAALRRIGSSGTVAWTTAVTCAVTPMLINTSNGAFDSGYADGLLATCMTAVAAGMVAGDRWLTALGLGLAVLVKPEGLPYGGTAVAVLWLRGDVALRAATCGWLAGAALWLPLQHDLQTCGQDSVRAAVLGIVAAILLVVLGSDWLLRRGGASRGRRSAIAALLLPLCVLALPWTLVWLGDHDGTMGVYLNEPGRALARLRWLPAVVSGSIGIALLRGSFGLTFLLAPLGVVLARRVGGAWPAPALALQLLLVLPLLVAPFLLSPSENLDHHLRSTLPRLLLHWTGAAWLLIGVSWAASVGRRVAPE